MQTAVPLSGKDFSHSPLLNENKAALLEHIRHSLIGNNTQIQTPFGTRQLTYADYTASGRNLEFIEEAMKNHVMPLYANTHTEANATGQQTTAYREQARQQIRQAVNASEEDLVIFCGSGATAAVNTLITELGLRHLSAEEKKDYCILIGPYEHHSNELPWRELGLSIIRIPEDKRGGVCLSSLESVLKSHQGKQIIGSFSAASNVTGILCDQQAITRLLHRYHALSFWDFAAAAPYVDIDMNPANDPELAKEALFLSTHKFIGGPGTPGILVVKRRIIKNTLPSTVGGGTVSFVTPEDHTFLPVGERREEGGTPAILESIRAGLVFQLKQLVGPETIEQCEHTWTQKIDKRWENHLYIERLGHQTAPRLSITSFRIHTEHGYLHHGFVTALLNDLFGIQVRGGCSCAGPYGHQLLAIDQNRSRRIQQALGEGEKLVKPGWVRFNLNYFLAEDEVEFILNAIDFVAYHGVDLLPYYAYDRDKDLWHFQGQSSVSIPLNSILVSEQPFPFSSHLKKADYIAIAFGIAKACRRGEYQRQKQPFNEAYNDIRDFVLAQDL